MSSLENMTLGMIKA